MVNLRARTVGLQDATLVTATLEGATVPTRVTVQNRLAGPVWPPRRGGVPAEGWDESGWEGVLPAGETVAIGYACPAPAVDPPLEVAATEPAEATGEAFGSAASVLRALGSPAPPRKAVPGAGPDGDGEAGPDRVGQRTSDRSAENARHEADDEGPEDGHALAAAGPSSGGSGCVPMVEVELPEAVVSWLDQVETRLERAEALADGEAGSRPTGSAPQAGSPAARRLEERLAGDAEQLRELTKRATALADRAERAEAAIATRERPA